jgi:hypothetical protein
LRTVAVSVPCITGPYASVNCTLTLLNSSVRTSPALGDGYARVGEDTARFSAHYGGFQAIVTSSGTRDSGLFETNLNDARYLPFEGSGAISQWRVELAVDVPQFDHATISDVVLHLRYHAGEGGLALRAAATTALQERSQPPRPWLRCGYSRFAMSSHRVGLVRGIHSGRRGPGRSAVADVAGGALPVLGSPGRGFRAA